ncbi:MAG: polyhydroxyalkanoic acid system family protein [Gammaproteobacteria bacterium]|nr:polyhydroxyalkanoic acid system family protein [Gammaproteobacteria bacterium]
MAGFKVSKTHSMSKEEIREAAELLAGELQTQYGLRHRWQGDTATFSRTGLNGKLRIDDDSISVSIRLGVLASAFERPLKQAVTDYLDKYVS